MSAICLMNFDRKKVSHAWVAFLTYFQAYRRLSGSVLSLRTMPQGSEKRDLLTDLQNLNEFINVNKIKIQKPSVHTE
jgi:hypothetical protein